MTRESNGGFLWKRKWPASINEIECTAGYPISNAFENNPNLLYKVTPIEENLYIKWNFNKIHKVSGFAVINHTIPETAAITIAGYVGGFGLEFRTFVEVISPKGKNGYIFFPESDAQYMMCAVSGISGIEFQIGELYVGESFQFPHNFSWSYRETFTVQRRTTITDEGVTFEFPDERDAEAPPEHTNFKLKFSNSNNENLSLYRDIVRMGKKVFIPSFTKSDCHFGLVSDRVLDATRKREGDNFEIEFLEDAT